MIGMRRRAPVCFLLSLLFVCLDVIGADWPQWRYGANRGAASPQELPDELHLQWVRKYPPLKPAWYDPSIQFDGVYEPVVMGRTLFIGSSLNDSVTAIDTRTGAEKWRFHTGGPVRFAPIGWKGKVYVASDDGYLYCLDAENGAVVWKFRGGPSERKVLGNGRLISTWPIRGGPVLADGKIYFAAGVWPFMGIFVHALDAETGEVVWTNDSSDTLFTSQHVSSTQPGKPTFLGVVPLGYLVAVGDKLLVPTGRARPACFDRRNGRLLYYKMGWKYELGGGWCVSAGGKYFFNGSSAHDLFNSRVVVRGMGSRPVLAGGAAYIVTNRAPQAFDTTRLLKVTDAKGRKQNAFAKLPAPKVEVGALWAKAGRHLLGSKGGSVTVAGLPAADGSVPASWTGKLEGTPASMIAADDKLFVVTREGGIYCFGAAKVQPKTYAAGTQQLPDVSDEWGKAAEKIIEQTGAREGYCLVLGVGTGRLAEELARQTKLEIIAVDPDEAKVERLRRKWDAAGVYGTRISLIAADPLSAGLPPYVANLIVSEDITAVDQENGRRLVEKMFYSLRPYGGVACLRFPSDHEGVIAQWVKEAGLSNAEVTQADGLTLLKRSYTVRLHFAEPDDVPPGDRLFDVTIQGRKVLKKFDIVKEAGGPNRPVVKEFRGVKVTGALTLSFSAASFRHRDVVLCGMEIVEEGADSLTLGEVP